MVTQKEKKQSINQVWLSILFMIVILGSFVSVAGISYYYETNGYQDAIELFTTDSNTEFTFIKHGTSITPTLGPSNYTSGYFYSAGPPSDKWLSYEKDPAYLGNNTWGISVNTSTNEFAIALMVIDLPDIRNWIITDVDVNTTLPGDLDIQLRTSINCLPTLIEITTPTGGALIDLLTITPSLTEIDRHIDVTTVDALTIHSDCQEQPENNLAIRIEDSLSNGMGGFAFQLSVTIYGVSSGGWNLETSLLISTIIWNILIGIVIVYSLDIIDLGGFIKTIKKPRRR